MIPLFKVYMDQSVAAELTNVLYSGYIGQGEEVEKFEETVKSYLGNEYVVTVNNGTAGLHLAVHMLKTKFGWNDDTEVLATPLTCTATNWPIVANRLRIKWVDVDPKSLNMDLDDLQRKITANTKLILPVHWGGKPIDLDQLGYIKEKTQNLYGFEPQIIEDCAHSLGATYKGRPVGNRKSTICMFSLQAIKQVTSVDGGIVTFTNHEDYSRARLLRWYGIDRDQPSQNLRCGLDIPEWGFKFHMNDVNAVIGNENFKMLDNLVFIHQNNARFYDENLKGVEGLTQFEPYDDENESAFWFYSIHVERRSDFIRKMKENGIMVSQVHTRNDKHSCMKEFRCHLPNMDSVENTYISIPCGWWVTKEDRQRIVDKIKEGW